MKAKSRQGNELNICNTNEQGQPIGPCILLIGLQNEIYGPVRGLGPGDDVTFHELSSPKGV
jgi:hypothetical protein